jgi:hypothetical protein
MLLHEKSMLKAAMTALNLTSEGLFAISIRGIRQQAWVVE